MARSTHVTFLPRRKIMTATLVALVSLLAIAALAFVYTADRISSQYLEPELNHLLVRNLEQELMRSPLENQRIQRLLDQFSEHPQIYSVRLTEPGQNLLIESITTRKSPVHELWHSDVHANRYRFSNGQHEYEILVNNQTSLPGYYLTETISTLLVTGSISLVVLFFLYLLVRRWQQVPYLDLQSQLDSLQKQDHAGHEQFVVNDPDVQPLADSLNQFYWIQHRRTDELARAHHQAESARHRATLLAQESARANNELEKEIQVRSTMERQLGHTKALLDAILNAIPFALFAIDQEGRLLQCNRQALAWLHGDVGGVTGIRLDVLIPELQGLISPLLSQLREAPPSSSLKPLLQKDATLDSIEPGLKSEVTAYALDNDQDAVAVVRIEDIRRRLKMEEMMMQSEKMLTVGGLAAGMAHEINNPLGAILQNLQNIRRRLGTDLALNRKVAGSLELDLNALQSYLQQRDIEHLMDHIQNAGERAAGIIATMLNFARRNDSQRELHSVKQLITNAVTIARNDLAIRQIELRHEDNPNLPAVKVIPGEIEQVLVNLIKNAQQALQTYRGADANWHPVIQLKAWQEGGWLCLSVEDNGPGVPLKVIPHVFEPFYTTKEVGQGTGLGLSVSYFIVTNHHHGQLRYQSIKPHGASFILRLPLI
ncbi:ATP-binding protein [Oceanobacter mangrovi]|uniref:ATP-binding protein n=1 Tax=Oceanobacter mangrovi TaxID=2862510 RepID=UPI001C8DC83C|nr:ATP-binding protein [Oceanobacter mangrovi]